MYMNNIHTKNFLKNRRKFLRNNATTQEKMLWNYLKGNGIGYKFQRQHSIGPFIVDFYCPSQKLIVELDGLHHGENKEYDEKRTLYLEILGYRIIRFWNHEINIDIEKVISSIKRYLVF